ncbi:HalOD1 output domain-containing protein [Natrinema sp. DC36]|uniref:HalOD1 output domain-containing protein n=1 Tax=Natrinema sp. DC36 TaxID=2878680 RepID=UPI001CEFE39A|nr:HalOD1 output domain-containing protein [Natrinema sp. DC36]
MSGPDRDPADDDRPVLAERTYDEGTPPSIAAVYAISAALDTDPIDCTTELGFTLYDHVDPEALDRLVTRTERAGDVTVELSLGEYLLRITNSGHVRVFGPSESSESVR